MDIFIWTETDKDTLKFYAEIKFEGKSVFNTKTHHISLLMESIKDFATDFYKYGLEYAQSKN